MPARIENMGGPVTRVVPLTDALSVHPYDMKGITQPGFSKRTMFADMRRHFRNLHRADLLQRGLNADLHDGKHGPCYMVAINGTDVEADAFNDADVCHPNLNATLPAAPADGLNVIPQVSGSNISFYVTGGANMVTAASAFAADNRVLTSHGTARVAQTNNPVTIADNGALAGVGDLTASGAVVLGDITAAYVQINAGSDQIDIGSATTKINMPGILDPKALILAPQAANPRAGEDDEAYTLWVNSEDSNALYFGSVKIS